MRLVDADKQLEWVDCMKPIIGIGMEPVVAVETMKDMINGIPTIDAIPVEWLLGLMRTYADMNTPEHRAYAYCLNTVIEGWKEEQEAETV